LGPVDAIVDQFGVSYRTVVQRFFWYLQRCDSGGFMRQERYEVESLGPIIVEIEKRQKKLQAIRPKVAQPDRKSLDLRLQALEQSRQILTRACKSSPPKMNAYFAGVQ
jgi:hypothetical protein